MKYNFTKHPSDIAIAANSFLAELKTKNKDKHIEVLDLFIKYLMHDCSNCQEADNGEFVVTAKWNDFYGGVMDNFINFFLVRNVVCGASFKKKSVSVMTQFVKWSYKNRYFNKTHYDEYIEALEGAKDEKIDRVEKLNELFYKLHSPDPGAWARGEIDQVKSINDISQPEEIQENYMIFNRSAGVTGYFKNIDNKSEVGPVLLSKEILKLLVVGDVANLTIGRFGTVWRVLETGYVYAAGNGPLSHK